MSEYVNTYHVKDKISVIPMERNKFYEEQLEIFEKTWDTDWIIDIVNILLFNESWELVLQKRSKTKTHNANLIDKTVWWHINVWNSADYTAMVETVQELQVPSVVISDDETFMKTYALLKNYLQTMWLIKFLWRKYLSYDRIFEWVEKKVPIKNNVYSYIWIYGGRSKNVDKEAKWILYYTLEDLDEEMESYPDMFTNDLKIILNTYHNEIAEFVSEYCWNK